MQVSQLFRSHLRRKQATKTGKKRRTPARVSPERTVTTPARNVKQDPCPQGVIPWRHNDGNLHTRIQRDHTETIGARSVKSVHAMAARHARWSDPGHPYGARNVGSLTIGRHKNTQNERAQTDGQSS